MAEVTRVPLQPIAKGSLTKFWLGVIVGAALASAVAWFTSRPASVSIETVVAGEGANPQEGDAVFIDYVGMLDDGTVFDESPPRPTDLPAEIADLIPEGVFMQLDGVVPGFREGLLQMQKGGRYIIHIPADLAYGATPPPGSPIPANADLTFNVTLHEFMTPEELEARSAQINAVMAQVSAAGADAPAE